MLDYLRGIFLSEAEVPGALRLRPVVDNYIRAVFAQAEAIHGVYTGLVEDAL